MAQRSEHNTPQTIFSSEATRACDNAVKADAQAAGYTDLTPLTRYSPTPSGRIPHQGTLSGTFKGSYNSYKDLVEGTFTCTYNKAAGATEVTASIQGNITRDTGQSTGNESRDSHESRGSQGTGNVENRSSSPSAGQRVAKAEYEIQPRVDSWEPQVAEYLMNAGMLLPGAAIYNLNSRSRCSVGHFATDSSQSRLFIVTAGHCGDRGSRWAYHDHSGQWIEFGEMVERAYDGTPTSVNPNGYDIGFIEITNPHARWTSAPPLTGKLMGYADINYVASNGMALCRIGSTDGLSCGNYVSANQGGLFTFGNQSRSGDSGGAVYAVHPNGEMYAVGVLSYGNDDLDGAVNNYAGAMEIYSALQHFGLSVI